MNGRCRLTYWNPKSSIAENQPLAEADCDDPFLTNRYAEPLVGAWFLRQVDTAQQPAFLVEGFDRCEEALQPFEAFLAFKGPPQHALWGAIYLHAAKRSLGRIR